MIEPRDQIVDPSWWETYLAANSGNVDRYSDRVATAESIEELVNASNRLSKLKFQRWIVRYSAGESLQELIAEFEPLVTAWEGDISRRFVGEFGLRVALIGRLTGMERVSDVFNPNNGRVQPDRFTGWIFGDETALESPMYQDPPKRGGIIDKRVALVQQCIADPAGSAAALKTYVSTDWYPGSRGAGWWGTHSMRGKPVSYIGYWCWEAAVIALACGVDDSALKGHKYYPYDLVHHQD